MIMHFEYTIINEIQCDETHNIYITFSLNIFRSIQNSNFYDPDVNRPNIIKEREKHIRHAHESGITFAVCVQTSV